MFISNICYLYLTIRKLCKDYTHSEIYTYDGGSSVRLLSNYFFDSFCNDAVLCNERMFVLRKTIHLIFYYYMVFAITNISKCFSIIIMISSWTA